MRNVRVIGALVFVFAFLALASRRRSSSPPSQRDAVCEGPRLANAQARQAALEKGYAIDSRFDCIDKRSYAMIAAETAAISRAAQPTPTTTATAPATDESTSLAQARQGFRTSISVRTENPARLPIPPANLFVRSDYGSTAGLLAAYITPDPRDGRKHPAIVWLTGGETNSLGDFWTPGGAENDQSASAFRNAGVVMMFPTLRGGNVNGNGKEYFYGEVDDVLAAAEHLAQQPYVDANRIYLGGHSTGGTLVLLTSEASGRFKAVFAFGPVESVDRYPNTLIPVNFDAQPALERTLRSPIHWLHGITSPTYIIEGSREPSNARAVEELCAKSRNPQVHCILAAGSDHFSVLARVTRVIAARIAVANEIDFALRPEEFTSAP